MSDIKFKELLPDANELCQHCGLRNAQFYYWDEKGNEEVSLCKSCMEEMA